jgi:hypothetical protein
MNAAALAALAIAAALDLAGGGRAQASIFGYSTLGTERSCASVGPTQVCDGSGPGQQIKMFQFGGGLNATGTTALTIDAGDFATSTVEPGLLYLPSIKAQTMAAGNDRMNINTFAFQEYTYMGGTPAPFSVTANLHIVNSSASPLGGALPGGAIYTDYVAIWDPNILQGFVTPQQLNSALFYAPCGTSGVLSEADGGAALSGGENTFSLTTSSCSGLPFMLNPGQSVLVVAGIQLPVNRGGFVDASHTFTTTFGDDLTPQQISVLESSLSAPEPGSWALMLGGFGLMGAALRRRRAALAA